MQTNSLSPIQYPLLYIYTLVSFDLLWVNYADAKKRRLVVAIVRKVSISQTKTPNLRPHIHTTRNHGLPHLPHEHPSPNRIGDIG
jgi:hypothetical protein